MSQAGTSNTSIMPVGVVETLTGNSGGAVSPDGSGNISTVGTGSITVVGNPGTNTTTAQLTGLTNHAVLVGAGTATISKVGPSATTGQILQSQGSSTDPAFSTATYPATTTINDILYSSSNNVVGQITTANNGVLITGTTGIPSILPDGTTGQVLTATTGSPPSWENAAASSISITGDSGGALTGNAFTFTGGTTGLAFGGATTTETLSGTLVVSNGGTGDSSFTAYAPICGGTTTTGALQVASTGMTNSGYVLTSTGASSLPTWQAAGGSSVVVQQIRSSTAASLTGTTGITLGSTPTNSEGTQILTVTITPANTAHILVIEYNFMCFMQSGQFFMNSALFQDSTVNGLYGIGVGTTIGYPQIVSGKYYMTAGTTSSTTFKLRVGSDTGGTSWAINGEFGGVNLATLIVTEYTA